MVRINRIYTKTGDQGDTGLVGGARISKASDRVEAYGDVDELNSYLGFARTLCDKLKVSMLGEKLAVIQNELFDLGSELASLAPSSDKEKQKSAAMPHLSDNQIQRLENWIDELVEDLPELRSFVLPGGTELNSILHISRTICRRAERRVVRLSKQEKVSAVNIVYLNRLSDLLFAMARFESKRAGIPEYLWEPGKKA